MAIPQPNFGEVFVTSFQQAQNQALQRRAQQAAQRLRKRQLAERIRARKQQSREQRASRLQQQKQSESQQALSRRQLAQRGEIQEAQLRLTERLRDIQEAQDEPVNVPLPSGLQEQFGGRETIQVDPRAAGPLGQIIQAQLFSQQRGQTAQQRQQFERVSRALRSGQPLSVQEISRAFTQPETATEEIEAAEEEATGGDFVPPSSQQQPGVSRLSGLAPGITTINAGFTGNIFSALGRLTGVGEPSGLSPEDRQQITRRRVAAETELARLGSFLDNLRTQVQESSPTVAEQAIRQNPSRLRQLVNVAALAQSQDRTELFNEINTILNEGIGMSVTELLRQQQEIQALRQDLAEGAREDEVAARQELRDRMERSPLFGSEVVSAVE